MISRLLHQFVGYFEKYMVGYTLKFNFGAAGAPTLATDQAKGVTSITRDGAGLYSIVFEDKFPTIIGVNFGFLAAAAVDLKWQVVSFTASTKTLVIRSVAVATETDPADGTSLYLDLKVRNSSITR
jgi:hypothetical protein